MGCIDKLVGHPGEGIERPYVTTSGARKEPGREVVRAPVGRVDPAAAFICPGQLRRHVAGGHAVARRAVWWKVIVPLNAKPTSDRWDRGR